MLFDLYLETGKLYESRNDIYPVRITKIYKEEYITNKPFIYAVANRPDNSNAQNVVVLIPHDTLLEEGDFILVKDITKGYALFLQRLQTKIFIYDNKRLDYTQYPRFIPNQFWEGKIEGTFLNPSTFYNTFVLEYLRREKDFLYKRFVKLPKYEVYRSYKSTFDDENRFWEIMNDEGAEELSRRHIFYNSENPIRRKELKEKNPHKGFVYRGDPIFDSLHKKSQKYKHDKILKIFSGEKLPPVKVKIPIEHDDTEKTLPLFEEQLRIYASAYNPYYRKLPNWLEKTKYDKTDILPEITAIDKVPKEILYSAYDEIISVDKYLYEFFKRLESKKRFIPYKYDIFYPKETKTIKLGRNKIFIDIYQRKRGTDDEDDGPEFLEEDLRHTKTGGEYNGNSIRGEEDIIIDDEQQEEELEETIFAGIKTEKDQQLTFLTSEINQVRLRNTTSVLLMEHHEDEKYHRTVFKNYKNAIIEALNKEDINYQHLILINTEDLTPLENGELLEDASYLLLLKNKDDTLKRTLLPKETATHSATLGVKYKETFAFINTKANEGNSTISLINNNNEKITLEPGVIKIISSLVQIIANTSIDGNLSVNGNVNVSGSLTVNGGLSVSGSATINGKAVACLMGAIPVPC